MKWHTGKGGRVSVTTLVTITEQVSVVLYKYSLVGEIFSFDLVTEDRQCELVKCRDELLAHLPNDQWILFPSNTVGTKVERKARRWHC